MTETWGGISLPVAQPVEGVAAGDKTLTVLGQFLQAAINYELRTEWAAIAPGTTPVPELNVFTNDPKHHFNEAKLPALYVFEQSSETSVESDEIDRDVRQIAIYWVARLSSQKHETLREPTVNAIGKIVSRACRLGRHPAWRVTGDTDVLAATRGSLLYTWTGIQQAVRKQAKPLELMIEVRDGAGIEKTEPFRGWMTTIEIHELYSREVATVTNAASGTFYEESTDEFQQTVTYPEP